MRAGIPTMETIVTNPSRDSGLPAGRQAKAAARPLLRKT